VKAEDIRKNGLPVGLKNLEIQFLRLKSNAEIKEHMLGHPVLEAFAKTADRFVKNVDGKIQLWAASADWFLEEWGRDTFISLPGLLLSTGRFEEAKNNIRNFARFEKNGLIPNRIWDANKPETIEYNTVDGSMWFIQALKKYLAYTGDWDFIKEMLPVMRNIFKGYKEGTGYQRYGRFNRIYMDEDSLIVNPAQSTWMDADPAGRDNPVTPRNGKAVDINALWYANLKFLEYVESDIGDAPAASVYKELAEVVKKSFNDKFWNDKEGALFDVIEGDPHGAAIRPNMIFAVSHAGNLLSPERQISVLGAVTKDLVTPYGLRTLSPRDSYYHGRYETWQAPEIKDAAYHQGTVWPWLVGGYIDALAQVRRHQGKDEAEIGEEIRIITAPLVEYLMKSYQNSINEVFDGDAPYNPGGTSSQAWSVAEVLRVMVEYSVFKDGVLMPQPFLYRGKLSKKCQLENSCAAALEKISSKFPRISKEKWHYISEAFVTIFLPRGDESKAGSGFIWAEDGVYYYVLTAAHVLEAAEKCENIVLAFDGGKVETPAKSFILDSKNLGAGDKYLGSVPVKIDVGIGRFRKDLLNYSIKPLSEVLPPYSRRYFPSGQLKNGAR
ncbi:MAG: hypothetical protein FJZ15_07595, partial [Candidatus Omnitrophica bacterium]|nr:hypothetical protein [Candidatus Omnitrophota bacterium]